jgi:hypothetical protein
MSLFIDECVRLPPNKCLQFGLFVALPELYNEVSRVCSAMESTSFQVLQKLRCVRLASSLPVHSSAPTCTVFESFPVRTGLLDIILLCHAAKTALAQADIRITC